MSMALKFAYEQGFLDERLVEEIKDTYPELKCECGEDLKVTETLARLYCDNRFCPARIADRLENMAKAMKVDDWGVATCKKVVVEFNLKSPYQVFMLEGKVFSGVSVFEKKIQAFLNSPNRKAELWQIVQYGKLPGIDGSAYKIFDGYKSMEDAYNDIEKYQVPLIAEKLGHKNDAGILSVAIYNTLIEYKDELLMGEEQFELIKKEGEKFQVAITGSLDGFTNKGEFVDYLNERYKGRVNVILSNTVTRNTKALVCDGESSTGKYKKAKKIQDKVLEENPDAVPGDDMILIVDNGELVEYLDGVY